MSPHRHQPPGPHDGNKVLVDENHPAMSGASYPQPVQPGLEVSPAWLGPDERGTAPGLQVLAGPHLYAEDENPAPHVTHQPAYHATDDPQALAAEDPAHSAASRTSTSWEKDGSAPAASTNEARAAKRRWRLWGIVGLVAALVVVGAVVGGVLGSRAVANGETAGTTASDTSAGETPNNGTSVSSGSIKRNSRLAVTGQRGNSNYSQKIRLFHQGPDDTIQYVDWTSTSSGWSKACKMNTLDHRPKPNGSFTTCTYRETHNNLNQWQLFYVDDKNTVRGQKFDVDGGNPTGRAALINEYPYQVGEDTRLACYWPYIVSQDADAGLRWTLHQGPWVEGNKRYYVNDTNLTTTAGGAASGTPLVALPVTQQFKDAAGFVYRGADGRVRTGMRTYGSGPAQEPAWEQGGAPLAAPVPAGAALAAFAVGRPYSADRLNTYVLYQDAGGVIQVVWQDDDEGGWQGPKTYAALGDAAPDTDIACVTQGGGIGSSVQKEQDMNRCFFQERGTGRLKEVWFDGAEWQVVGFVPVDYGDGRCV